MPITGQITGNGDGIECSWITPTNGHNVLQSTTLTYSSIGKLGRVQPSAYLDANKRLTTELTPNRGVCVSHTGPLPTLVRVSSSV